MSLYTLIFDFEDGTYITQANAKRMEIAAENCIREWDIRETAHNITEQERSSILEQLKTVEFISLNNLKNIWCSGVRFRNTQLVLKLVLTKNDI